MTEKGEVDDDGGQTINLLLPRLLGPWPTNHLSVRLNKQDSLEDMKCVCFPHLDVYSVLQSSVNAFHLSGQQSFFWRHCNRGYIDYHCATIGEEIEQREEKSFQIKRRTETLPSVAIWEICIAAAIRVPRYKITFYSNVPLYVSLWRERKIVQFFWKDANGAVATYSAVRPRSIHVASQFNKSAGRSGKAAADCKRWNRDQYAPSAAEFCSGWAGARKYLCSTFSFFPSFAEKKISNRGRHILGGMSL